MRDLCDLVEDVVRGGVDVHEQVVGGRRISDEQNDVEEVQQVVEQFDEIVGGHRRQQDVVGRHHRRPAEHHL